MSQHTTHVVRYGDGETLTFIQSAALPGVELLFAEHAIRRWHVFHERYAVCTCDTAAAGWRYRGKSHLLTDGAYMLLEPGEAHANTRIGKRAQFQVIFMSPAVVAGMAAELGLNESPHLRLAQDNAPGFFRAYQRLCAAVRHDETPLEQQSRLSTCAQLLMESYAERTTAAHFDNGGHRAVQRAKEHLRERFNEAVTLDELAAAAGLSRFHLLRTFNRHVGLTPHAYQIHVRIERARTLLQAGVTPSNVALMIGFADQSHFTRHFRRVMRATPSRYARIAARRHPGTGSVAAEYGARIGGQPCKKPTAR